MGELILKPNGLISMDRDKWFALPEEEQKIVQEYNARLKHNEDTSDIQFPEGVTLVSTKARRKHDEFPEDLKDDSDDDEVPKGQNKRKKVRFNAAGDDDTEDEQI